VYLSPLPRFTLDICNSNGAQKTRMMPQPECQKVTICPYMQILYWHWTDRLTDGIVKSILRSVGIA